MRARVGVVGHDEHLSYAPSTQSLTEAEEETLPKGLLTPSFPWQTPALSKTRLSCWPGSTRNVLVVPRFLTNRMVREGEGRRPHRLYQVVEREGKETGSTSPIAIEGENVIRVVEGYSF